MFATRVARYFASAVRAEAPVWLRTARTTNIAGLEVHPDPLPVLESTYTQTLKVLETFPESSVYRQSAEAVTEERLSVLSEAVTQESRASPDASELAIAKVVEKLDSGLIEEILKQAHDEFQLAAKMIDWKPYVTLFFVLTQL